MRFIGMTKHIFRALAVMSISAALLSCGKDEPENGKGGNGGNGGGGSGEIVEPSPFDNADLYGTITDAATGEGIADVPVTDGFSFTKTNSKGEYGLKRNAQARKVYYTTPEGYKINLDPGTGRPLFYSDGILATEGRIRKDFKLTKLDAVEKHLTIIAVGDPQCENNAAVARFKEETIADMQKTVDALPDGNVYAITLGDIIYDSNDMWTPCADAMASLSASGRKVPFFQCIGNHDHDGTVNEAEGEYGATLRYVNMYGPTDYSFDRHGVHVVVMDNIKVKSLASTNRSNGKKWGEYSTRFDDDQEKWLEQDLGMVADPGQKTLILCMHAPMNTISSARAEKLLDLMTQFKEAHIFSGHTHWNRNTVHESYVCRGGKPVYEHTHATACGMWWKSNSDISGCPAGYSVYSVTDGVLEDWRLKGSTAPADFQIRAYNGSDIYPATSGSLPQYDWFSPVQALTSKYNLTGYPEVKDCLVADIFNSDDKYWTVELYVDGSKAGDFTRVPDDALTNICHAAWSYGAGKCATVDVRTTLSNRLWYIKPAQGVSELKNWEIIATQTIPGSGTKHTYKCSTLTDKDNWSF